MSLRPPSLAPALVATVLATVLGACAENAILEVELDVPNPSGGTGAGDAPEVAMVDVREMDSIDAPWPWDSADVAVFSRTAAFTLSDRGACSNTPESVETQCNVRFAVETSRPDVPALAIRVRLCDTAACSSIADQSREPLRYVLERPFYRGRVTRLLQSQVDRLGCTEAALCIVPKCRIAGCISGPPGEPDPFCLLGTSVHRCEQ